MGCVEDKEAGDGKVKRRGGKNEIYQEDCYIWLTSFISNC
jgi:hypothetical protein